MKSNLLHLFMLSCLTAMLLGVAPPAQAGVSDAWVTAKVKMLLMNSPSVGGLPINVDTNDGRVTLHGMVPTNAEKTEAGRIARAGTGVLAVRNLLQVVPDSRRKAVNVADDRIQEDISAALKAEPALKNSSIHAKTVTKGVVLLDGKAASLSDHLLAIEVTSSVPGVRQVSSQVDSPDQFGDREVWYDDAPVDATPGNAWTDGWITTQTKTRFMTDADVPARDINVDTRRGVVTLFGTVPNAAAATKAVQIAKDVSGVSTVKNELRVVKASKLKNATANDAHIESAVRRRLADAKMEGTDIKVDVKAATARLSGTVSYPSQRYAAVSIAYGTPGVVRVQNDLRIELPKATQVVR